MPEKLVLNNPFAIVGDEDLVLGFGALGFKSYAVKEPLDFKATLEKIIADKIAICLVQEKIYQLNLEEINHYRYLPLPIFIPFAQEGKIDLLEKTVKDMRLKATGVS